MRLKILAVLWLAIFCLGVAHTYAQQDSIVVPPTEVDFLFHYYEQDGDNAAVTGGTGTQSLQDRSALMVIRAPIDSFRTVHVHGGFNLYTSASTDRIDAKMSSASAKDGRGRMYVGYSWQKPYKPVTWFVEGGASIESDYVSTMLAGRYTFAPSHKRWEMSVGLQAFFDRWIVYYPDELRGGERAVVPTDKRRSYNLSLSYARTINRKSHFLVSLEPSIQTGLLATPFHRVYVKGDPLAFVEKLPTVRYKWPVSVRYHIFLNEKIVLRTSARGYGDSFGLWAYTTQVKLPLKLMYQLTLAPSYRWHQQSAARYFAPFGEHLPDAPFATSDFDLSALSSHLAALHLTWKPIKGIGAFRLFSPRKRYWESIDISVNRLWRSDGLRAQWVGFDLGFSL